MAHLSVHLATTHRPTDPRIFQKECRTLAAAGFEVRYIVPGEANRVVEGVQILSVPVPATGRERLTHTTRAVYRRALQQPRSAIFHVHDWDLLPAAFALKARGRRVVYDMHEDTPRQMLYQHWIPRVLRPGAGQLFAFLEALGARVFDGLVAAEPVTAARFPHREVAVIHNYPIVDELAGADVPYADRPNTIVYVGSMTAVRGLREVVQAVGLLPESLDARLELGGTFHPPEFRDELEGLPGWDRTMDHGWADRPLVAEILGRARVGVVALHPTEKYLSAYPTKLFEYMVAGIPVVCSDFPKLRPFVEGPRCGLLVDPQDPGAISDAIRWLLEHPLEARAMGSRGREAVLDRFNWSAEGERLVSFYAELLSQG